LSTNTLYPAWLNLNGLPTLMVGAGKTAQRKAKLLLASEADLTVVAKQANPQFERWADEGRLRLFEKEFEKTDLSGKRMVLACTADPALNLHILKEARQRSVLASSATYTEISDFYPGAAIRRGPLAVSVSSGGGAPVLVRVLRDCLGDLFSGEWEALAEKFSVKRSQAIEEGADPKELEREIRAAFLSSVRKLLD
jgi:uroporphyrin-III C-methyltransferase/precorrin-2 dehydrogenase/sirohydrochlorin ferrochelatase